MSRDVEVQAQLLVEVARRRGLILRGGKFGVIAVVGNREMVVGFPLFRDWLSELWLTIPDRSVLHAVALKRAASLIRAEADSK